MRLSEFHQKTKYMIFSMNAVLMRGQKFSFSCMYTSVTAGIYQTGYNECEVNFVKSKTRVYRQHQNKHLI